MGSIGHSRSLPLLKAELRGFCSQHTKYSHVNANSRGGDMTNMLPAARIDYDCTITQCRKLGEGG